MAARRHGDQENNFGMGNNYKLAAIAPFTSRGKRDSLGVMATFIRIGEEIINLDNVLRVEHSCAGGERPTVLVYFIGDGDRSQSQYTDEQAAAVWGRFKQLADRWEVPDAPHTAPAGAGRIERGT